jgi:hypothetical protein
VSILDRAAPPRNPTGPRRVIPQITWPEIAADSKLAKAVASLRAEHERLDADLRAARADAKRMEAELGAARKADRATYAASLREGKDEPGHAEEDLLRDIADTQRKADGLLAARTAVQQEVEALLTAHADEFGLEADAQIASRRSAAIAALDALTAAVAGLQQAKSVKVWLTNPTRGPAVPTPYLPDLKGRSGDPINALTALAAVMEWLAAEQTPIGYLLEPDN